MKTIKFIAISLIAIFVTLQVYKICSDSAAIKYSYDENRDYHSILSASHIKANIKNLTQNDKINAQSLAIHSGKILKRAPLNDDVILHAIYAKTVEGNEEGLSNLFDIAKDRNPRNTNALQFSIDHKIRAGELKEAIDTLDLLYREDKNRSKLYVSALTTLYAARQGNTHIDALLRKERPWAAPFIAEYITLTPAQDILPFLETLSAHIEINPDQVYLVQMASTKLAKAGLMKDAYRFAESFNTERTSLPRSNFVYNSEFKSNDGIKPFDWTAYNSKSSLIDFTPKMGVYVTSKRNSNTQLLQQTLKAPKLEPLKLSYKTNTSYNPAYGTLEWRVLCRDTKALLTTLPLQAKSNQTSDTPLSIDFVNESCDFIDLQLWAMAGELSGRISLEINSVEIRLNETN